MKKTFLISISVIIVGIIFVVFGAKTENLGSSVPTLSPITTGVWAVHNTSTNQVWSVQEVTGNLNNQSTNSSANVSSTAVRLLAPNTGRVDGFVCNNGTVSGWISRGTTVTTTAGQSNYFSTSTGILVPSETCFDLTR